MKRLLIWIAVIVFVAIAAPWVIAPVRNNLLLHQFSAQLYRYRPPSRTEIVETHELCGKLNGNGNGMDFMAAILVKSDLTPGELKDYYAKAGFRHGETPKSGSVAPVALEIVKPISPSLESRYLEHGKIIFDRLKNTSSYADYEIVVLYDGGYSADFDIRGH